MTLVIDTNVILVANGQHADVSMECVAACVRTLGNVADRGRVAIDDNYRILLEYQKRTAPHNGKRPGDMFVKWLLQNKANQTRCDQVPLVEHSEREFEAFPDDARLANFDPPDRKFVAVAAAHHARPPIAQAADSKWLGWEEALRDHGITVNFLCPDEIRTFDENKRRRKRNAKSP